MKKIATIIYLCSVLCIQSYGQSSYQVKPLGDKGNFIYPPHSNLKLNCKKTALKSGCTFQYIYIDSIKMKNGTYYSVLDELIGGKNTEYFTSSSPIEDICFDTQCYGCYSKKSKQLILTSSKFKIKKRKPNSNTKTKYYTKSASDLQDEDNGNCGIKEGSGTNFKVKYSFDQKALLLQIDYGNIINNHTPEEIKNSFFELSKNLLLEFSKHEKNQSDSYDWFTSISQNLVEKIFERIPIPQEASLAKYGLRQETSFSLLPLNPKIHLRVDHSTLYDSRSSDDITNTHLYLDYLKALLDSNDTDSEKKSPIVQVPLERNKTENALQTTSWRFQFTGQTIISYSKFQDNNGDVFFKFDPFIGLSFPRSGATNNFPDPSRRLLSSSIDLEFTQDISKSNYLFLFQKFERGTNSNSSSPGAIGRCCRTNPLRCNSLIFYRDDFALMNSNFSDCDEISNYAIFGERSPIVPLILIEINSNKLFIPFGYTLFDLISNGYIKGTFKLNREFSKGVVNVKNPNFKTILHPGDVIKSK
jgi:hypothetical protein